jgi:hypothetical protein
MGDSGGSRRCFRAPERVLTQNTTTSYCSTFACAVRKRAFQHRWRAHFHWSGWREPSLRSSPPHGLFVPNLRQGHFRVVFGAVSRCLLVNNGAYRYDIACEAGVAPIRILRRRDPHDPRAPPALLTRGKHRHGVWAIGSSEVFQLLRSVRRWDADKYREWLSHTLVHQLLTPET